MTLFEAKNRAGNPIGVGVGIGIGIELLKTDSDADSDPRPRKLTRSHRIFNPASLSASPDAVRRCRMLG
ncbi:MAG: hypothetical protein JXR49_11565 [Acidobacteria bacterium]|nr:hypothetical protein [Acidobacteriota bacterium]